ncbi:uncharacterized protein LOC125497063 [Beta vulgaris subsp. vulgaris]|uniref:uncharacterized protein LOC125497063 n=1 Tax=Beta vulgaris subsp. vulgaris TaxID=3555 RepID=UPI0025481A41|nr:uncharacterized protein LOC125497063 [Beta vulgaris subsp. vulgaris]XP_048499500.2 uncharacterized protein LOC125497063 [Beta vulgaris subsp. vulgaris]
MANDFGQGLLDESTYPVSERYEHVHGVLPQPILLEEEGDKMIHHHVKATSSTGGRFIEVQLPEGAMTDGEIVSSARNAIHEAYLFLKRDMEVISHVYTKRFQTFQELATDLCFGDASLSSDSPEISQTQEFFSDPEVLNMIDGIVEKFTKMRSATELFRAFGGPSGGAKRVVDDVGHDNEEGSYATRSCKAFCSLDCGELGGSITYVSCFMKSNARLMTSMSRLALEVVDYSMVDDSSMDSGESLVTFGLVHIIPREDMLSLDSCKQIFSSIVECYSLFLNELNRLEGGGVRKFFFGVRHSLCLLKLFDYRDSDNSSYANDLQNCWEEWVTSLNSGCDIFVANLIYVPVLYEDHYILFVIDHLKQKVQYLDNRIWGEEKIATFRDLSFHVCDQMGDFLAKRNHPNAELVPHYKFEVQEFDWKSSKSNNDCGVFLIHHMQFYEGTKFDNVHLMKALGRRFLRAQICATLVLSDMNESRNDTLSKLDDFNKNRDVLAAEVRSRKKAIVVAQKERMNQEKEKAQKMVGLEKGSGTKVKRIIKKRRLS